MPKLKTAELKTGTRRVWWDAFLAILSPIASSSQRGRYRDRQAQSPNAAGATKCIAAFCLAF